MGVWFRLFKSAVQRIKLLILEKQITMIISMKCSFYICVLLTLPSAYHLAGFEETNALPSYDSCGKTSRLVTTEHVSAGSRVSSIQVYPWTAAIIRVNKESDHQIHCQGSLITIQHILSAAHCYKSVKIEIDISQLFVVLGSDNPLQEGIKEEKRKKNKNRLISHINEIDTVYIHAMYNYTAYF